MNLLELKITIRCPKEWTDQQMTAATEEAENVLGNVNFEQIVRDLLNDAGLTGLSVRFDM